MKQPSSAAISLPEWCHAPLGDGFESSSMQERMQFVIDLAARNVKEATGGPFAAAVFESGSGRLIAAGLNLVVASSMAIAHAEMVAIALAGVAVGNHDLATAGATELFASTEPCAMCLGAVGWSGVVSLVCGATESDARDIGFDEGAKPADWPAVLEAEGISVTRGVLRNEAAAVLSNYVESGGVVYNGRAALGD